MRPFSWLSLFLIAIYFVYGAYVPFWSLWLESKGLSAEQIGLLIGLGLGIRFAGNLLIMGRANRASLLIPTCRYLAVLSLLCYLGFYWVDSFWALLALMLLLERLFIDDQLWLDVVGQHHASIAGVEQRHGCSGWRCAGYNAR